MLRSFILFAFLGASSAGAQTPDMLQRAITILQSQRNQAMDALANSEVQRAALAEQVDKLKAELEELKKRAAVEQPQKD